MKQKNLFTLRTGAVNYTDAKGNGGILYPIHPNDSEEQIKAKLKVALVVHSVAPDKFDVFSEAEISKVLGEKQEAKKAPLVGAAKAAAEKKAKALEDAKKAPIVDEDAPDTPDEEEEKPTELPDEDSLN